MYFLQCTVVSHLACVRVGAVGSAPVFVSAEVCLVQVQQCVLSARHMTACSCGAVARSLETFSFRSDTNSGELRHACSRQFYQQQN